MKRMNAENRRGHRWVGTLITVAVVLAVLLCNVLFSFVADRYLWQVDESVTKYITDPRSLYTVTDDFIDLMGEYAIPMVDSVNEERVARGEEPITVNIIFCAERDYIYAGTYSRYCLYTALGLQKAFPEQVKVSFINVKKNPSAVQKYKVTSATNIYPTNVIFEFGTEYRVYSMDYFFKKSDTTSTAPWAYNGEMDFSSAILAVTRAESPVACFTTNHGEKLDNCAALRELVSRAGYIVTDIDLEKDELPENCRMIITYDPQTDFYGYGNMGETGRSEIEKLDEYLDKAYSFMLFVDNETPQLPVLEEYLEEWGVVICRAENADGELDNYLIRDSVQKLDREGYTVLATYATQGLGASITKDMRSVSYPAKVVFPNATAIRRADAYSTVYVSADETSDGVAYQYDQYYRNGVSRIFSNIFTSGTQAVAEAFGEQYEIATEKNPFRLMTVTSEERTIQETNYITTDDRSFLCVVGSTEFASDEILTSAVYGNADVLVSCLRAMGREVVPVNLEFKAFKVYDVDASLSGQTTAGTVATTVCLALIPAAICFGAGIFVTVRRKYR